MPGKASVPKSPPLRGAKLLIQLHGEEWYFNDDNFEDCYYNVNNAEDSKFTDGHEEDDYLNDDQGVKEAPGAYQEASTTMLAIKDQLLPR